MRSPPDFPRGTFEVDDLDQVVKMLCGRGFTPDNLIVERRDSRWFKLHDPAGNLLQLVEVKPAEA